MLNKLEVIKTNDVFEVNNDSNIFYNNSLWNSNYSGKFKIIGAFKEKNKRWIKYLCEFDDGFLILAYGVNIRKGTVRNKYSKTVFGVGYIGEGKYKSKDENNKTTREWNLWSGVLERCYSEKLHKLYPTYKGTQVSERWLNFQIFCEDIEKLENYHKWKNKISGEWNIDKDLICESKGVLPKIYSPETCCFLRKADNIREATYRKNKNTFYKRVDVKTGKEEFFYNMTSFYKKNKLDKANIYRSIKNEKPYRGYIYYKIAVANKDISGLGVIAKDYQRDIDEIDKMMKTMDKMISDIKEEESGFFK